jgi:hypothetical protein
MAELSQEFVQHACRFLERQNPEIRLPSGVSIKLLDVF